MEMTPSWQARDSHDLTSLMSRKENFFVNICDPDGETASPSFLKSGAAGLIIGDPWEKKEGQESALAWFKPSSSFTSVKKLFLQQPAFAAMDFGVDPYSLALWQSRINRANNQDFNKLSLIESGHRLFRLSGQAYSMAGADDVQELALLLISAIQLVQDYEGVYSSQEILQLLSLEVSLRPHVFRSMAKLCSLRILLDRLFEEEGDADRVKIYGVCATRYFSSREPWNNLLRLTACQSAAVMGGADGFVSLPFDLFSKDSSGQRLTRNSMEILLQESFLARPVLPVEGSFYIDSIINDFCTQAWSLAREMIQKGGLTAVLRSGWIQEEIERSQRKEMDQFMKRDLVLTGVNQYALTRSLSQSFPLIESSDCIDIESWWDHYHSDEETSSLCVVKRIVPLQLSLVFESWQFRADDLRRTERGASLPVLFENAVVELKKGPIINHLLGVAGIEAHSVKWVQALKEPLLIVASADPEGDFVKKLLVERGTSHQKRNIWVGEKMPQGFHLCVNERTHMGDFFDSVFDALEDKS